MKLALIPLILLAGCFPVRPDTDKSRTCTAYAKQVADSKFRAGDSMDTLMTWIQNEGKAYDECMK